jgi:hypothetical protein
LTEPSVDEHVAGSTFVVEREGAAETVKTLEAVAVQLPVPVTVTE